MYTEGVEKVEYLL